jgi:hypothetical protein
MQPPDGPDGIDGPDDGYELITPEDFLPGSPFPPDARRMGIDRWSDDAAMIAVAASLDPAKPWHRVIAWVLLLGIGAWLLATLWFELT